MGTEQSAVPGARLHEVSSQNLEEVVFVVLYFGIEKFVGILEFAKKLFLIFVCKNIETLILYKLVD